MNPRSQDPASEVNGRPAHQGESNRPGNENQNQKARLRILKCARGRDGGAERKRGRRKAGDDQRHGGAMFHLIPEINEELRFHQPLQAFLAAFAANEIQQEDTDCGANGRGKDVERELIVMAGNQKHREQITPDRKEEKGVIRDREEEQPERAKLQGQTYQIADRQIHLAS